MPKSVREVVCITAIALTAFALVTPMLANASNHADPLRSNLMTLGRAIVQYAHDSNETLPFASAPRIGVDGWRWNMKVRVPEGWENSDASVRNSPTDALAWINVTRSYYVSDAVLEAPGRPAVPERNNDYFNPHRQWARVGYAYNGLLHTYTLSEVVEPRKLPLLWPGYGLVNLEGFAMANPVLSCMLPFTPCRYGSEPGSNGVMFSFSEAKVPEASPFEFLSTDLTLYTLLLNNAKGENTDPHLDPWTKYSLGGPSAYWTSDGPGNAKYPRFFKPDSDFSADQIQSFSISNLPSSSLKLTLP